MKKQTVAHLEHFFLKFGLFSLFIFLHLVNFRLLFGLLFRLLCSLPFRWISLSWLRFLVGIINSVRSNEFAEITWSKYNIWLVFILRAVKIHACTAGVVVSVAIKRNIQVSSITKVLDLRVFNFIIRSKSAHNLKFIFCAVRHLTDCIIQLVCEPRKMSGVAHCIFDNINEKFLVLRPRSYDFGISFDNFVPIFA